MLDESSKLYSIYKLTNPHNTKVYVGQTSRALATRFADHKRTARLGSGFHIHAAMRKYGIDNFSITLIEEVVGQTLANEREEYWIKHFDAVNSGYNLNYGANDFKTMRGYSWTRMAPADKQASILAKAAKHKHWWATLSEERRTEIKQIRKAESLKARSTLEHKLKASAAHEKQWANRTQEQRQALSKIFSQRKRKHYLVTSPAGNVTSVFGLKNFCDEHGLHQGAMNALAQGKGKTYKGWKCQYDNK